jgi:hypothetical protein
MTYFRNTSEEDPGAICRFVDLRSTRRLFMTTKSVFVFDAAIASFFRPLPEEGQTESGVHSHFDQAPVVPSYRIVYTRNGITLHRSLFSQSVTIGTHHGYPCE